MTDFIKLSISIPLDGILLKKTNLLLHNFEKKYNLNFIKNKKCRPHINLFSGTTNKSEEIKKILIKNKKKFKKNILKTNGFGVFLRKNPTIYIRYKNNINFNNIRSVLFKNLKYWKKVDYSVLENVWLPKTTIIHKDLNLNSLSNVSKYIIKKSIPKTMNFNEIVFLDFTDNEIEIDKIVI